MLVRTCSAKCNCICHTYEMADIVMGGGMPTCCHTNDPFAETKQVLKDRISARKDVRTRAKTPSRNCIVVYHGATVDYYFYGQENHLQLIKDKSLAKRLTRAEAEQVVKAHRDQYPGSTTRVEWQLV